MDQSTPNKEEEKAPAVGILSEARPNPATATDRQNEQKEPGNTRGQLDRIKPWLEVAVALIAFAGLIAIYWQLNLMRAANSMTRESLQLTRESNASSDKITERTLRLMEESNRLTREALEESKSQAEASRTQSAKDAEMSRKQSAKDAASSLSLAKEAMQRSESPWLVIEQVTVDLTPGRPVQVKALVSNMGRTSAYDPHTLCSLVYHLEDGIEPWGAESQTKLTSIGPGQPFTFGCTFPRPDDEEKLRRRMIVLVEVVFTDSFKNRQVSAACYNYEQGELSPCKEEDPEKLRAKRLIH